VNTSLQCFKGDNQGTNGENIRSVITGPYARIHFGSVRKHASRCLIGKLIVAITHRIYIYIFAHFTSLQRRKLGSQDHHAVCVCACMRAFVSRFHFWTDCYEIYCERYAIAVHSNLQAFIPT
jgi:hypothetical protein